MNFFSEQVRAYDLETLVANVGGYVGLFLGYAILQTPLFLLKIYDMINIFATRIMQSSKPKNNSSPKMIISGKRKGFEGKNLEENINSLKESVNRLMTRIEDGEQIVNILKQNIQSEKDKS